MSFVMRTYFIDNKLKLDKVLTPGNTYNINFLEQTNVENFDVEIAAQSIPTETYASIEYGNITRYYYLKPVDISRNGLYVYHLEEDYGTTWSAYIKNQTGIAERQENLGNMYLKDDLIATEQRGFIVNKRFSGGDSSEFLDSHSSKSIVLICQ